MHHLTGEIRDRHVATLRKRVDYLESILKQNDGVDRHFQWRELAAIRAVLLCAKKIEGDID